MYQVWWFDDNDPMLMSTAELMEAIQHMGIPLFVAKI